MTKNYLNLDHDWRANSVIGTIQNPRWEDNSVKGDLYINPKLTKGKDTITQIDSGLIESLSVELMSEDLFDKEDNKTYATDIEFIGCAVIYGDLGACKDAKI